MGLPEELPSPETQGSIELQNSKAQELANETQDVEGLTKKPHRSRYFIILKNQVCLKIKINHFQNFKQI